MQQQRILRILLAAAIALLLAGVLNLYAEPDFLVQLSNQVWACF